jgi:hypothetical protein
MGDWQMGLLRTGTRCAGLLPELVQAAGLTRPRPRL